MAFSGVFTPVLAKHSKSFSLIDCISVGVDRMRRNFEPMRKQIEVWQRCQLTDVTAKVVIYEAFVEGNCECGNDECDETQSFNQTGDFLGATAGCGRISLVAGTGLEG